MSDSLKKTNLIVSILAGIVGLVATVGSGVYWWMTKDRAAPQPTIVVQLPANANEAKPAPEPSKPVEPVAPTPAVKEEEKPAPKDGAVPMKPAPPKKQETPEIKEEPPPKKETPPMKENPPAKKEAAPPREAIDPNATPSWHEDFEGVTVGDLPKGWRGNSFGVIQGGGAGTRLEATSQGSLPLSIPEVALKGAFFAEWHIGLPQKLEITLIGKDGSRDLPIALWPTTSGTTATVELPGGDARTVPELIYARRAKLRLEREGAIHRVYINNTLALARRISGYGDFAGMRLTFTVDAFAKGQLFAVRTGPIKAATPPPAPKKSAVYREDFQDTAIGDLPAGWSGTPTISVVSGGAAGTRLEVNTKGMHQVQIETPRFDAGFYFECEFELGGGGNKIAVNLTSPGGKPLAFGLHPSTSGTTLSVYLPGLQPQIIADVTAGRKHTFRLEREGGIGRSYVNGKLVAPLKLKGFGAMQGVHIQFTVDPGSHTRLYALAVGPLK